MYAYVWEIGHHNGNYYKAILFNKYNMKLGELKASTLPAIKKLVFNYFEEN